MLYFACRVRGLSLEQFGLLQAMYYLGVVCLEVPSGVVADRVGRKATLVVGALVNGLGCFLFALAHSFGLFAIAQAMFACGTALISGADSAMLFDSLAADRREHEYARAEGAAQAAWLLLTALGLPLADLLLVRGGDPVLAFWATGGLVLLGAACAAGMVEPPVGQRLSAREITAGAVRDVLRVPGILRTIVYSVGVFALLRAAIVIFFNPALLAAGVGVDRFGTVLAVVNVTGALAAWRAHRWLARLGERTLLAGMPVALGAMYLLLVGVKAPLAALFFCLQGAVFGVYPLIVRSLLNRRVPSARRRATVLSIESLACRIAFAPLAALAGWALGVLGLDGALALVAALACLPFLLLPLLRRGDV